MKPERDKILTEAMGECWLEYEEGWKNFNNDFSTWEGFGKLWEWAIKQEWFDDSIESFFSKYMNPVLVLEKYINPDRFADALYKFLKEVER